MIVKGGMLTGADGRVHTTFGHNPSSLRLCSFDPNLQNIPRGGEDISNYVKEIFIAPEGKLFWERDFSGIEAVLVGYFAGSRSYTRLAKRDVHSFYTAYALNALDPGRVSANDLPDLSWEDSRLFSRLAELKKDLKHERNSLYKHLVHGANYLQSPNGARDHIFKQLEELLTSSSFKESWASTLSCFQRFGDGTKIYAIVLTEPSDDLSRKNLVLQIPGPWACVMHVTLSGMSTTSIMSSTGSV
jgi:hypothetical protein